MGYIAIIGYVLVAGMMAITDDVISAWELPVDKSIY